MSDPKDGKPEETQPGDDTPKIHFLKADRSLRPEGSHFEAEAGVRPIPKN
eukprot:CAMPEP_0198141308 /NCGR_PEP_ID=MMETSP1443-20131203/4343_1 /TAXON_ID=186043 /ORGANISM="Entomoneis sp., Strain CCMP2396" /LENGTH=49 /DNA_ID=CAMNT_0043804025 /DNA_START=118 /DNA_END=267 /DNA_ORIENTATION=+